MMSADTTMRYPRIPHLPGSSVIDDDRALASTEIAALCATSDVIAQEKLDGTNVGVMVDDEGRVVCLKRAGLIGQRREHAQYGFFRAWVLERSDLFRHLLGTRWIAYGELMWQRHSVRYTKLPDWVVFFDLLDRKTGRFASLSSTVDLLGSDFSLAPTVYTGQLKWPFVPAKEFASSLATSAFGDEPSEGVVLRFERRGHLVARAKYRSSGFQPGHNEKSPGNCLDPR